MFVQIFITSPLVYMNVTFCQKKKICLRVDVPAYSCSRTTREGLLQVYQARRAHSNEQAKKQCTTTKISLLMSSFPVFPRFVKAIGCAQEGRRNIG